MEPDDLAESGRLGDYQPMLSRLCTLLVVLWLVPLSLVGRRAAYREYLRQKNAPLNFGGVIPRIIIQEGEEKKLEIEILKD
jgi:hypothetical protein